MAYCVRGNYILLGMIEGKNVELYYLKEPKAVILNTKIKHSSYLMGRIM